MRSFFNMDGPIFVFLSKMADFMILNLLFVICCLPIVTIGAAVTAMSYVCIKMKEGTEGYIWKSFLTSFRMNVKQATVIWLIMAAFLAVLIIDLLAVRTLPGSFQLPMQIAVMAGLVLWLMIFLTVFPLQSRFYNPVKTTLHNALLLAVANTPRLLLVIVVSAGAVVVTLWNATTLGWGILLWMMFGFALLCYFNIMLIWPTLKKLMPQEEEEEPAPDEAFTIGEEEGAQPPADPDLTGDTDLTADPDLTSDPEKQD